MSIAEHWLRFPKEVMESPVMKIFKPDWTLPGATCCSWLCLKDRAGAFQPQLFHQAVIHPTAESKGIRKALASYTENCSPGYSLVFQDLAPHGRDTVRKGFQKQRNLCALFRSLMISCQHHGGLWSAFTLKPTVSFATEMAHSRKGRHCTRFNFSMKFTYKPDLKIWVRWRQEESTAGRRKGEGDD